MITFSSHIITQMYSCHPHFINWKPNFWNVWLKNIRSEIYPAGCIPYLSSFILCLANVSKCLYVDFENNATGMFFSRQTIKHIETSFINYTNKYQMGKV